MRIIKTLLSLVIIFLLGSCESQAPQLVYNRIVGPTMGTVYTISYRDSLERDIRPIVDSFLFEFNQQFSTYDTSAILSKWNRAEENFLFPVTEQIHELISSSIEFHQETQGFLDISIAPAIQLWKFYGEEEFQLPNQKQLDSVAELVGMDFVHPMGNSDQRYLVKTKAGIQIDVNSIAPGYAVDGLYQELVDFGLQDFIIDIGGEVRTYGSFKGGMWKIGIQKPETASTLKERKIFAVAKMYNGGLATSGNYQKFKELNGLIYGHTFNPTTLSPEQNNLLSVTTYCSTALEADAYSTALMSMGLEQAKEFVENNEQVEALIIFSDSNSIKTWNSLAFPIEYIGN